MLIFLCNILNTAHGHSITLVTKFFTLYCWKDNTFLMGKPMISHRLSSYSTKHLLRVCNTSTRPRIVLGLGRERTHSRAILKWCSLSFWEFGLLNSGLCHTHPNFYYYSLLLPPSPPCGRLMFMPPLFSSSPRPSRQTVSGPPLLSTFLSPPPLPACLQMAFVDWADPNETHSPPMGGCTHPISI